MGLLRWAIIFFVVALIAALFGFTGISSAASGIAQILFYVFLVLFLVPAFWFSAQAENSLNG